jgi:hypothetical protein
MSTTDRPGDQTQTAAELQLEWDADPRWDGVRRDYTAEDVIALRGPVREERTLARRGAEKLWEDIQRNTGTAFAPQEDPQWSAALGALTGNQAVQQVRAGLKAIYLSGWQVAADANLSGQTYPDQSLYPANSVPAVVRRINNALLRAGQIEQGTDDRDWMAPIVADAEAGFGGPLNAYELMGQMIEAGAAGVHWEDSAREREEVRPHGRQGADPDVAAHPHHQRGTTRSGCRRRAVDHHRPHRRARRDPAHERPRRARPSLRHGGAHRRGLLRGAERHRAGHRPRPRVRRVRRPALGRVGRARPRPRPAASPRPCTRSSRASA